MLGGGGGERSLQSLAGPDLSDLCLEPLGYPTWPGCAFGRITHGIRRDRERRFWLQSDARDALIGTDDLDRQTPRTDAETHGSTSPTAIAMQLGERVRSHRLAFLGSGCHGWIEQKSAHDDNASGRLRHL